MMVGVCSFTSMLGHTSGWKDGPRQQRMELVPCQAWLDQISAPQHHRQQLQTRNSEQQVTAHRASASAKHRCF